LTVLGQVIGILGTIAAVVSLVLAKWPHRDARHKGSVGAFVETRQYLKAHIPQLTEKAIAEHREFIADPDLPMLTRPGWVLPEPVPLGDLVIRRDPEAGDGLERALKTVRQYWPTQVSGLHMERYHEAVTAYDKPGNWFNGASYRLLDVAAADGGMELAFTDCWYWDNFDTTEVLLYEAALEYSRSRGRTIRGRYRRYLRDPFDLTRRCTIPGIDALTIRRDGGKSTFYLHRRGSAEVASALNTTGIVPAGEFQPSDDSIAARAVDFDLWKSILREYAEEFLDLADARDRVGAPIDYLTEEPYAGINAARSSGAVRPYVLGIGLDPCTWKPTILTVCVFEAGVFDEIFADMISANREGILELPQRARSDAGTFHGWPWEEEMVAAYVRDPAVFPAARSALALTWRFRERLGLAEPA